MFSVNSNSKEREALGLSVRLVSLLGIWSVEKDETALRIRWAISTFSMTVVVFVATYESYLNCVPVENNVDNLYCLTFGMIGLSKVFLYYVYRQELRANVDAIVQDWSSKDAENYSVIMHTCMRNYKNFTKYFVTVGIFTCMMYIVKVLVFDPDTMIPLNASEYDNDDNVTMILKRRFIFPATCIFNGASEVSYWTIFVLQLFQVPIAFGTNFCSDTFFIAIASHLCTQFEILKIKFATFSKFNNASETREEFNILITRHMELLELAQNLETAFAMIVFVQMVINVFILSVAGLNVLVLLEKKELVSALTIASIMVLSLVQTFMYSYVGDRLTSQGDDIAQAVYQCEWYSMPRNFSKDLIHVMARSGFPIGLTAGKFFKMTRSTFTDIVKTAASYLSVLRIIIKDDI